MTLPHGSPLDVYVNATNVEDAKLRAAELMQCAPEEIERVEREETREWR